MKTPNTPEMKKCSEKAIDEIKSDYLNGESKVRLYKKYGLKYKIDKFSFMNILNNIEKELGFKSKNKKIGTDWNIDSKMQMNLESEYNNSTYIEK